MTYEELADFIGRRMRMAHIYQPVMLIELLKSGGRCTEEQIARALLRHDASQVEYYAHITRDMVGRVLRSHEIVERGKDRTYQLTGFEDLKPQEIESLTELCEERLTQFLDARGNRIFAHRRRGQRPVSGTLKYRVLKRAGFHCELCGVSADDKALEVDHILPRNHGGTDDPDNLQALCFSCNAMKRDRDDTDFRAVRASYRERTSSCVFCDLGPERIVAESELAVVIRDAFPVTELHSLVIPRRHVASYFDLHQSEVNACFRLLDETQAAIRERDPTVEGFNIGINDSEAAGQTVFHCHIHLIPRRLGDVSEPRGGVRHTIPGKGSY